MNLKVGTGSGLEPQLWNYLNPGVSVTDLRTQTETYRWKTTVAKSDFQENRITLQDRRKGSLGSKQEGPEMS